MRYDYPLLDPNPNEKMASVKEKKKSAVKQFCSITGAEKEAAKKLLEVCNYNVEVAINMHVEAEDETTTTSNRETETPSPVAVSDGEVRAPIPPVRGVLVESFATGIRTRRRIIRSVFDGFRDFQAETRQQEQELFNEGASSTSQKRKTLEDLFRPPLDVMHRGTFDSARDVGLNANKWLMVNIQNVQEFPCQVLNRDVWSSEAVKSIIREHFVFWQVYHDSEEGLRYMQFYKVLDWPYVAIIDPRTGEKMIVWNKIDALTFCDLVSEFLTEHPSLDGSFISPPAPKRLRSESILDASEDSQLEAAIRASLIESATPDSSTTSKLNAAASTSTCDRLQTSSSQNTDEDDEDEEPDVETFETDSEDSKQTALKSEAKVQTVEIPNGNRKLDDWRMHIGTEDDPKSNLAIRFPDGSKDQLCISSSSKLLCLILYIQSKGFEKDKYELVTNFPRRQLSTLDSELTLKEAGLFPQETIFVQNR